MSKAAFTLFMLGILVVGLAAQPALSWKHEYSDQPMAWSGDADRPVASALDSNNNFIVTGFSRQNETGAADNDAVTFRYSPAGVQDWVARYGGTGESRDDSPADIAVGTDGSVYVVGTKNSEEGVGGYQLDIFIAKYNSSGTEQWVRLLGDSEQNFGHAVAADKFHNVYIAGTWDIDPSTGALEDIVTAKYNSEGTLIWSEQFPTGTPNMGNVEMLLDSVGNTYVGATEVNAVTGLNFRVVKYSSTGFEQWATAFTSAGNRTDRLEDMVFDNTGNVVLAGTVLNGSNPESFLLTGFDTELGEMQWSTTNTGVSGAVTLIDVVSAPFGTIYAVGLLYTGGSTYRTVVNRYEANGVRAWTRLHGSAAAGAQSFPAEIDIDYYNNPYVLGTELRPGDPFHDLDLYKYSAAGVGIWQMYIGSGATFVDSAATLRVRDDNGEVYVSGFAGLSDSDYVTAKVVQPAYAVRDGYTIPEGAPVNMGPGSGLLWNDQYVGSGVPEIVGMPTKGRMELNADGSFRYTPNPEAYGVDLFSYRVRNGSMLSNTAEISVTINAATPASVAFSPNSVIGGNTASGIVTLNMNAPSLGAIVALADNTSAILTPETMTVPNGAPSGEFTVSTSPVSANATRQVTATRAGVSRVGNLTLRPGGLVTLLLNPTSVTGGDPVVGQIGLSGPAEAGGQNAFPYDNSSAIDTPSLVVVPAGQSSVSFSIGTSPVSATATRQVYATVGTVTKIANLTLTVVANLNSLILSPTTVQGGNPVQAAVTLTAPAPSGGAVVTLSDNSGSIDTPPNATVLAGNTSRVVTVGTSPVGVSATRQITATYNGVTRTANLTLTPPSG